MLSNQSDINLKNIHPIKLIKARLEHLHMIAAIFNDYRVFYKQPADLLAAKNFIEERLKNNDSTIFFATDESESSIYGFVQLYTNISSVRIEKQIILNDLFIDEKYRQHGIARHLLRIAKSHAIENGFRTMILETHYTNTIAQKLYLSEKYSLVESQYLTFSLNLMES